MFEIFLYCGRIMYTLKGNQRNYSSLPRTWKGITEAIIIYIGTDSYIVLQHKFLEIHVYM